MIRKQLHTALPLILLGFILFSSGSPLRAQPELRKDFSFVMEIPSVMAMESSSAHLYVLSESEGMVVFRAHADTLQWLYSSTGMERRGDRISADIRFAYLHGADTRLTVLEPTSVLGVYSSTRLPQAPLDAERVDHKLYVALGGEGIGWLSLRSPSSVDSTLTPVPAEMREGEEIIDLESSGEQLFALASSGRLLRFAAEEDGLRPDESFALGRELGRIFLLGRTLMGSDADGNIYEIDFSGELSTLGAIGEPVGKIERWRDWLIIQGESGRIWTSHSNQAPRLWKEDRQAGYAFTAVDNQLWLSEYNQVSRVIPGTAAAGSPADSLRAGRQAGELPATLTLQPVNNRLVPYPKPVIAAFALEEDFPPDQVRFAYQSTVSDARIRGNSFFWQPSSGDVGTHRFKIIATASNGLADSTSFSVEVNSFNVPPRFAPLRPLSIPVGETFTLRVRATDPDGTNRDLIRYLGVDLPDGASLDEKSGEFRWTPDGRQTGEHNFRVIATDQYGAASSADLAITVVDPVDEGGGNGNGESHEH